MVRPALLVLVRHGESARNVVKKDNRFYLDDEARKSLKGVPDHRIPLTDEERVLLAGLIATGLYGDDESEAVRAAFMRWCNTHVTRVRRPFVHFTAPEPT